MKKSLLAVVFCMAVSAAFAAFEVEQVFRPERFTRGNTNLEPLQPIDAEWAEYIWGKVGKNIGSLDRVMEKEVRLAYCRLQQNVSTNEGSVKQGLASPDCFSDPLYKREMRLKKAEKECADFYSLARQ